MIIDKMKNLYWRVEDYLFDGGTTYKNIADDKKEAFKARELKKIQKIFYDTRKEFKDGLKMIDEIEERMVNYGRM